MGWLSRLFGEKPKPQKKVPTIRLSSPRKVSVDTSTNSPVTPECPYLTESGMCEPPEEGSAVYKCSWEKMGKGHYSNCNIYQCMNHPGGKADFMQKKLKNMGHKGL